MIKAIVAAVMGLVVTAIWWCLITFIAFAITKSGGTGEWINDVKPYVLAGIFLFVFIAVWLQLAFVGDVPRISRRGFKQ